jgi:hypothetical protein
MLCIQNIGNLYRKNAFDCVLKDTQYFLAPPTEPSVTLVEKDEKLNEFSLLKPSDPSLSSATEKTERYRVSSRFKIPVHAGPSVKDAPVKYLDSGAHVDLLPDLIKGFAKLADGSVSVSATNYAYI